MNCPVCNTDFLGARLETDCCPGCRRSPRQIVEYLQQGIALMRDSWGSPQEVDQLQEQIAKLGNSYHSILLGLQFFRRGLIPSGNAWRLARFINAAMVLDINLPSDKSIAVLESAGVGEATEFQTAIQNMRETLYDLPAWMMNGSVEQWEHLRKRIFLRSWFWESLALVAGVLIGILLATNERRFPMLIDRSPKEVFLVLAVLYFLVVFGSIGIAIVVMKWRDFWNGE